jgi:hypothetical protein
LVETLVKCAGRHGHSKFTTDDAGNPLPPDTVIRLAELAAALGFRGGAIEAIMAHLVRGVADFQTAVAFYDALPPELANHPSSRAARQKALPHLTRKIEELNAADGLTQAQRAQLRQGRDALALCLGPVSGFFVPEVGGRTQSSGGIFKKYTVLPLRSDIKQLSLVALWHLLASEQLQVESENEGYLLVACWAAHSDNSFHRLVGQIRWQHLTDDFIANCVAHCPMMRKSGGPPLANLITAALAHRHVPPAILAQDRIVVDRNRGNPPGRASWTLRTGIQVEETEASMYKIIGQASGYPVELAITHEKDRQSGEEFLGLFVSFLLPNSTTTGQGADPAKAVPNGATRAVWLTVSILLTGWHAPRRFTHRFAEAAGGCGYGHAIPLALAAHGTQYFPTGRCEVELTVTLVQA